VLEGLQARAEVSANRGALKQQVAALPGVTGVSLSGHRPMQRFGNSTYRFPFSHLGESASYPMPLLFIDEDFMNTYGITLLAGRDFLEGRDAPSVFMEFREASEPERQGSVLINASAARMLGLSALEEAGGRQITAR